MHRKKWYDYSILTNFLLLAFFPLGLFALWKSNTIAIWWKVTATGIISFFVLVAIFADPPPPTAENQIDETPIVELTPAQKDSMTAIQVKADSASAAIAAKEARQKSIDSQFSDWDGSHRNLERLIKDNMNDPDSYEHVETRYWDMENKLVVATKYRGKNAFGGKVLGYVKAEVDLSGNVLKILDQE